MSIGFHTRTPLNVLGLGLGGLELLALIQQTFFQSEGK